MIGRPVNDIAGLVYGDFVVVWYAGRRRWLMRCTCGETRFATGYDIRRGTARRTCSRKPVSLTKRESQIAELVVEGLSNKEIARRCAISKQSVKNHLSNIFKKFSLYNRTELAVMVVRGATEVQP